MIHNYNVNVFQILVMTTPTSYSVSILIGQCYVIVLHGYFIILQRVMPVEMIIKHAVCVCLCACVYMPARLFLSLSQHLTVKHEFLYTIYPNY